MNPLVYYDRQKAPWHDQELENIKEEYVNKELTVIEIADIHHRTPGSICYKLTKLGLIHDYKVARGYSEYKDSTLYKEIVESSKKKDDIKKAKSESVASTPPVASLPRMNTYTKELIHLQGEITSLKQDVKEILRLMNALYEFESQQ